MPRTRRLVGLGTLAASLLGTGVLTGAQAPAAFDSARAWAHLQQLVDIGPRPAGSPGIRQTRDYIKAQMKAIGVGVEEQTFTAETPQGRVQMVNLVARLAGRRPEKILVTGHYDTKPFKEFRFVGANDAGSSAAFLLEFARAAKDRPREFTWELVWFDGEEAFCLEWTQCRTSEGADNTYGSRYYVRHAQATKTLGTVKAMILVDMIGERNARFQRESSSTGWLKDIIWSAARTAGHGAYFPDSETPIEDDHYPFLQAGVPAVDIIDLDYAAWHTAADTLDKLDAKSLQAVGDTLLGALPQIEARLTKSGRF